MRRSSDRILTTHTGSLPRPADLDQLIADRETGKDVDTAAFNSPVTEAVADIVASQLVAGMSVISDGEMGNPRLLHLCEGSTTASAAPAARWPLTE